MTTLTAKTGDYADKITRFTMASDDRVRFAANRLIVIKILGSTYSPRFSRGVVLVRFFYDGRRRHARKNAWIDMPQLFKEFDNETVALDYARAVARALGWVNFKKKADKEGAR